MGVGVKLKANRSRSGLLFYVHDGGRRWGEEGSRTQVPGGIPAGTQGQLYALAGGTDTQLSSCSSTVSDRGFPWHSYVLFILLTRDSLAICFVSRNRLDRIPFVEQLFR